MKPDILVIAQPLLLLAAERNLPTNVETDEMTDILPISMPVKASSFPGGRRGLHKLLLLVMRIVFEDYQIGGSSRSIPLAE
jgi:hypothetical protein